MISDEEKKYIYPAIAVIVIIILIVIVLIWSPKKENIIENTIDNVPVAENYVDIQKEKYISILNRILLLDNYDELYEKINKDWIDENKLSSKQEIYDWLFENFIISSVKPNIVDTEVFTSTDIYIYKFFIDINGVQKNITINEYAPNNYDISFEQDEINALSNKIYNYEVDGLQYLVTIDYASDSVIQYTVKCTNTTDNMYEFNFTTNSSANLGLENNENINAIDITTATSNQYKLGKNGTFELKFTFNINLEKQSLINSINFTSVYKNNTKVPMSIFLNGGDN